VLNVSLPVNPTNAPDELGELPDGDVLADADVTNIFIVLVIRARRRSGP
jgi:hypothetical protein